MTTQFTPGPWKAADDRDGYRIEGYGNPMGTVAILATRRSVTGKADASLIAAAPDLYAALSAMADRWEPDTEGSDRRMWEAACAALAKARGEKTVTLADIPDDMPITLNRENP